MSFSAVQALLETELPTPEELEVDDFERRLAEKLNMRPQEVKFLIARARNDVDNLIVAHAWSKLIAVIKLRDNDDLQKYLEAVEIIRTDHLERVKARVAALAEMADESAENLRRHQYRIDIRWDETFRDYTRFEERLQEGMFLGDFTPEQTTLLKELQRWDLKLSFRKYMGWRGRKVQLIGKLPVLDADVSWFPLAQALVR